MEQHIARKADHGLLFSEGFLGTVRKWGIPSRQIGVFPFWTPSEDIPLCPKNNQWAYEKGLVHTTNLIYAGTLGTSHSPVHFVTMARKLVNRLDVKIVVVSQGPSVRYLESEKKKHGLDNLILLTHEPFSRMPDLFGAADVLLTVLNQDVADSRHPVRLCVIFVQENHNLPSCRRRILSHGPLRQVVGVLSCPLPIRMLSSQPL